MNDIQSEEQSMLCHIYFFWRRAITVPSTFPRTAFLTTVVLTCRPTVWLVMASAHESLTRSGYVLCICKRGIVDWAPNTMASTCGLLLSCLIQGVSYAVPLRNPREKFDQPHTSTDYRKGFGSCTKPMLTLVDS